MPSQVNKMLAYVKICHCMQTWAKDPESWILEAAESNSYLFVFVACPVTCANSFLDAWVPSHNFHYLCLVILCNFDLTTASNPQLGSQQWWPQFLWDIVDAVWSWSTPVPVGTMNAVLARIYWHILAHVCISPHMPAYRERSCGKTLNIIPCCPSPEPFAHPQNLEWQGDKSILL